MVPKFRWITEQKYDAATARQAELLARKVLQGKEGDTLIDKLNNINDDDIRKVLAPQLTVNLSFQGLALW